MSSAEGGKEADMDTPFTERTAWAMNRIEHSRRMEESYGNGLMFMFAELEEATRGKSTLGYLAAGAKWASIWFFMIVPVIAMWNVVYG